MSVISIIIPTHNRCNVVGRAIESVVNQTSSNWELIIVDDGSTDETEKLVREYQKNNKIKYCYQNHKGVSSARNTGIQASSGDYLIFFDSDDELYPNLIQELEFNHFRKYDLIFWFIKKKTGKDNLIQKPRKLEKIYNGMTASFLAGGVCFRKDIIEKVGGFDPKLEFGENYEMGMRIAQLETIKTKILPSVLLQYNFNANNRLNSKPAKKLKSLEYLLTKHLEVYKNDSKSHARLVYQIGYLNEKLGNNELALEYYNKAGKIYPWYWKPKLRKVLSWFK